MNRRDLLKTAGGVLAAGGLSALEKMNPYTVEAQAQQGASSISRENGVVHVGNLTIFCNEDFMGRTQHRSFDLIMSNNPFSDIESDSPYVKILTGQRRKAIGVHVPHGRKEEIQLTLRGSQHSRNDYTGLNIPQRDDFYNLRISAKASESTSSYVVFINEPNKTPEVIMVAGKIGVGTGSASMLTDNEKILRNDKIGETGRRSYAMPLTVKDLNILTGESSFIYTTRNGAFVRTR